jgi:hypothetical protein
MSTHSITRVLVLLATLFLTTLTHAATASPSVPFVFIPGYAASSPTSDTITTYIYNRGASPTTLNLSPSYAPLVRKLKKAGYVEGKTFFAAVYDWRMAAAPTDNIRDGNLSNLTAAQITSGKYDYAINYLGYWLEQCAIANKNPEYIDVATHSTGGVLARAYIQSPAYGATYTDKKGVLRRLPKIRHLILGACINEGTVHSYRPWTGDFQDVLSGFIPTTEIEARMAALAYASVCLGKTVSGPDHNIKLSQILRRDENNKLRPDPVAFFRLYTPMRQSLMPTSDFLLAPGSDLLSNVNDDPEIRSDVALDLNALSTPGSNPWAARVGKPANGIIPAQGGVIATFATGARQKTSALDFITPFLVDRNPYVNTLLTIEELPDNQGDFLPLLDLVTKTNPVAIPITSSKFQRTGTEGLIAPLAGDGNGPYTSYSATFPNDPKITLVQWGNGLLPSDITPAIRWTKRTPYPVYHDVFYFNPDVGDFVITTITGSAPTPDPLIASRRELADLQRFLDVQEFRWPTLSKSQLKALKAIATE